MEICSYDDTEAIAEAVGVIRAGGVVGTHFGTVFGLLVDDGDMFSRCSDLRRRHKPRKAGANDDGVGHPTRLRM